MDFLVCIQTNHHSGYQFLHHDTEFGKSILFAKRS